LFLHPQAVGRSGFLPSGIVGEPPPRFLADAGWSQRDGSSRARGSPGRHSSRPGRQQGLREAPLRTLRGTPIRAHIFPTVTRRNLEYLQLVTRHQASIHGYIRSIAPGAPADDILQEANVILWERADTFEPGT